MGHNVSDDGNGKTSDDLDDVGNGATGDDVHYDGDGTAYDDIDDDCNGATGNEVDDMATARICRRRQCTGAGIFTVIMIVALVMMVLLPSPMRRHLAVIEERRGLQ